ncbi:hypothetical protein [Paenibacillus jilunlii]|uniref:hypothetical protein n=1 Tax=Paenibacillus jilunlii TaxID=682956 RepID=UPI000AC032AB|nr:hypothetical protein [Paenibacillus jilunlii]
MGNLSSLFPFELVAELSREGLAENHFTCESGHGASGICTTNKAAALSGEGQ